MNDILLFDSTLRDGSHAVKQQITRDNIINYCKAIDDVGMYAVIVGHGNGMGASSIQMGMSLLDEIEMLKIAAENLTNTKLGAFVTVGFGTIKDHIIPAMQNNVQVFCIATHCTEADILKKQIEYISRNGKEAYGVLMNYHMTTPQIILEQAYKIQDYGADGIILMDSAGASTPELVEKTVSLLVNKLNIRVGFHAHNNMGIAVANSYTAIKSGATIIDGTVRGFGAGAGNCQLEAITALLEKNGYDLKANLYKMLDASENVVRKSFGYQNYVDSTCIISGYSGVVSTFKNKTLYIAEKFGLDPRDIFIELGRRKAIAGQDDLILEVAEYLFKSKNN